MNQHPAYELLTSATDQALAALEDLGEGQQDPQRRSFHDKCVRDHLQKVLELLLEARVNL